MEAGIEVARTSSHSSFPGGSRLTLLTLQLRSSALYICLFLSLLSLIGWALHLLYPEPTIPALASGQWMTRWEEV